MEENLGQQEQQQMNTFKEIWKQEINGIVMPTSGEDGVIQSVNQAAALVANRDPFSSVESVVKTTISGNKLEITTPFPLKRMTLVQQSSTASQYRIERFSKPLAVQSSFSIHAPGESKLYGGITHIGATNHEIIKSGTYTLEIDSGIVKEGLKVLVEPALDYTVSTYDKEDKAKKTLRKCMRERKQ